MKYTVVLEKEGSSYGAFVPDLPVRIAVAEGRDQTLRLPEEAVAFHVGGCVRRDCRCRCRTGTLCKRTLRDRGGTRPRCDALRMIR